MYFYLTGIDHKRAPIDARDQIYRTRKAISDFWAAGGPYGSAVFVTCNRIEIYGVAMYADDAFGRLNCFAEAFPDFAQYAYIKYGETEVFHHALRLATGLESQIKGEGQIVAQLNRWRRDISSRGLNDLWDKAISISEKIRRASRLDEDSDNLAVLVFEDICKRLETRQTYEAIVLGTGKVAELFARHCPPEARVRFAAHKHYKKAEELAASAGGEALHLEDLPGAIAKTDVLICATSSPHYVVNKSHLRALDAERGHPLYIYDLAIPRDVEPQITAVDGIFLQNLDDLGHVFSEYNESRRERIDMASGLIEDVAGAGREAIHDACL